MDFEKLGMAIGHNRDLAAITGQANSLIAQAHRNTHRKEALVAGVRAQAHCLREALREIAPDHPLLVETGRTWRNGGAELGYQVAFDDAHDAVAIRRGVPRCERALSLEDRAARTERAILETPIPTKGWFSTRWYWRGIQHRTRAGAERARAAEAVQAREAALAA